MPLRRQRHTESPGLAGAGQVQGQGERGEGANLDDITMAPRVAPSAPHCQFVVQAGRTPETTETRNKNVSQSRPQVPKMQSRTCMRLFSNLITSVVRVKAQDSAGAGRWC